MQSKKVFRGALILLLAIGLAASCSRQGIEASEQPPSAKPFSFQRKPRAGIVFISTQLNPVEEAGKMRNSILKDFPGKVDFKPNDSGYLASMIDDARRSEPGKAIIVGATHGDLVGLYEKNALRPLNDLISGLGTRDFLGNLDALSRLDGKNPFYVPWIQASFLMVANKKALPFLPKGVDINFLSYYQLGEWARRIKDKTGTAALGFPAGKNGLMHRFFQGYLYPSFTASTLLKFRSPEAKAMWAYFKDLWSLVHPGSISYSNMSEPLLAGDIWIAWDHSARLMKALMERPEDFVAFPAPIGPKGRGYMAVISGIGVPVGAGEMEDQAILIDYLTRPEIQLRTLSETGFFPVVPTGSEDRDQPSYLQELERAMGKQVDPRYAIPTLMPIGLGEKGGDYNNLFTLTFSEVVLGGKDIGKTLDENADQLQKIIDQAKARCWLPDVSEARPCKLE